MGVQIPQGKGALFWGCPGQSKVVAIFAAASLPRSVQMGSFNRQYSTDFTFPTPHHQALN